jgi:hypothetical protein
MRALWLVPFFFLSLAACGGGDCSHAKTECGACETGFTADDKCVDGEYQCNCVAADLSGVVQDGSQPADLSSHD